MLTDEAVINGAIDTAVEACRQMMDRYEQGNGEYRILSVRDILTSLGYKFPAIEDILQTIYDRGFTYCLDPKYHSGRATVDASVCAFGADQLESRLYGCRR